MPLTIFKRGDIWHFRGTVADRRLRGSTHTADKTTALRIAAEIEARHWKGHLDGPASVLTFAQAVALYQKSGRAMRYVLSVLDYWKNTPVKAINSGAVRQAAMNLHPKVTAATRNRQVIVPTQAIINHAAEMELCPRLSVKRFSVIRKEKEPATWPWVEAFMSVSTPHLAALAAFMFLTGARISEALSVTWTDLDLSKQHSLIRQTKVGSERHAHLPPALVHAIANIEGERSGRVFKYAVRHNLKTQWEGAIRRAGIKRLTPHSCRHGFATSLLQAGVDVRTVAELGGWKTPALVLSTYGHAIRDKTVTDRLVDTLATQAAVHNAEKTMKITA